MEPILIYDVTACPENVQLKEIVEMFKQDKTLYWDSSNYPGRNIRVDDVIRVMSSDASQEIKVVDLKGQKFEDYGRH